MYQLKRVKNFLKYKTNHMTHGSLFSGIGGFDLAAEWMGWENIFHCEWNPFGQKVLKHYWPNSISYNDIKKTDFTIHRGAIDILTGGFPCQPYSAAGKRLGKADERHLFPEMLRAIKEIKPRWIIGENVRGLVSWNGGMVFHEVHDDLEREGYEVQSFLIPAASVNAPHQRYRIFFVAYAKSSRTGANFGGLRSVFDRFNTREENATSITNPSSDGFNDKPPTTNNIIGQDNIESGTQRERTIKGLGDERTASNSKNKRRGKLRNEMQKARSQQSDELFRCEHTISNWNSFPTVSPIHTRDDGVSSKILKFVVKEFYDTDSYTSEKNRIQNLQEVRERISQEEIWQKIRGLYSLESKNVLLQTMQLYSTRKSEQRILSPFSEKFCEPIMQHLQKHKEFRCSPQGQELEKQRFEQFGNSLSFLPHEVALAARRFETAVSKFEAWHRNESIKAAGNAVVPQLILQIFKAIEQFELNNN
jgi:DNA-cytosine methyltransferase